MNKISGYWIIDFHWRETSCKRCHWQWSDYVLVRRLPLIKLGFSSFFPFPPFLYLIGRLYKTSSMNRVDIAHLKVLIQTFIWSNYWRVFPFLKGCEVIQFKQNQHIFNSIQFSSQFSLVQIPVLLLMCSWMCVYENNCIAYVSYIENSMSVIGKPRSSAGTLKKSSMYGICRACTI